MEQNKMDLCTTVKNNFTIQIIPIQVLNTFNKINNSYKKYYLSNTKVKDKKNALHINNSMHENTIEVLFVRSHI